MTMGLRGRDEHKKLCFEDLAIETNRDGLESLRFTERVTKTRAVEGRATPSRYFCTCTTDPRMCLVEQVKLFNRKKAPASCVQGSPFYMTPIPPKYVKEGGPWYRGVPLGKNKIGSLMPDACSLAGIDRHTNHGARRTAVKRMRKAGIPDDKIIKITGHRSTSTLAIYDDDLDEQEHCHIQDVITKRACQSAKVPVVAKEKPVPVAKAEHERLFEGATFSGCNFTFNFGTSYQSTEKSAKTIVNEMQLHHSTLPKRPNYLGLVEYSDSDST